MKRRDFVNASLLTAGAGWLSGLGSCTTAKKSSSNPLDHLQSMTGAVKPITVAERQARIAKAQRLLQQEGMQALLLDAGTSLEYFTGVSWWPSERTMVAIIPVKGEVSYISPAFEVPRLRELITIGNNVYGWEEDESPSEQIVHALSVAGITGGKIGLEESVRYFILNGLQKAAPQFTYVSGDPITIPCRLIKSAAEIALMQKASDITVAAMKVGLQQLHEGMTPSELSHTINAAHQKLGAVPAFALVNFGEASAFPHGSRKPQQLQKGDVVLMDCGCEVEGYESDITRTIVFGKEPTPRQLEIWNLEKKAQAAGFAAARLGAPCENVDAAARSVINDAGFGPGYKLPGLPHRTGHGIGLDGHEWGYMVKGNKLPIQVGMCFSIEPTIAIVGEFGVRLEDCVYMTENGPQWFSQPSVSISQPFA